ncbi:hypothetical protein OH492_10695 [Vibrio chagasii]|nr:hypothetical protein [Vibrio chagasii]
MAGRYDSGVERGVVTVDTQKLLGVELGDTNIFVCANENGYLTKA